MNHCPICNIRLDTPLDFQMHDCPEFLEKKKSLNANVVRIEIYAKRETKKKAASAKASEEILVAHE